MGASKRIQGITIEIGGDTTKLTQALRKVDTAVSKTKSALGDINKLLKFDPTNAELLSQKQKTLASAVNSTKERLEQLKEASKNAADTAKNYDEWKAKYDPIQEEIKETSQKLKDLRDDAKVAQQQLSEGKISKDQYDAIEQEITETSNKLKELKQSAKDVTEEFGHPMSAEQYDALQREIIATETELKNLEKEAIATETELKNLEEEARESASALGSQFRAAGDKIKEVGDKVKAVGDKMADVGKSLTTKLTVPIVAIGTAGVKAATDWETAFVGVQKTVDATDEEFEQLAENIKNMASETASSKEEIAGVMEVAGQLGVQGVDNLTVFTKTMVELGDTTNLSADEAATSLARFMNITGDSMANVDKIGSAVVDLGNNFATSESEIVEMSTRLASAGKIAGLSSTDILALATAMSSVGIQAEAGGTAMTQTLTSLESAVANFRKGSTKELDELAKALDFSAEEFATAWENEPIEAIQMFIDGLGGLSDKGESATLVLDELGYSGIRQSNMLRSLSLANEMLGDAIDTSSNAYAQNTALADEAQKRYDTMAAKMSQLKERIGTVAIEIGERLMPYVERLMDKIDGLIEKWDSLDDSEKDNIIRIAAVAAAIGPVLIVIGKLTSAIGSIISFVGSVTSGIGQVITFVSGTLIPALSSIGTVITGTILPAIGSFISAIGAALVPILPLIAALGALVASGILVAKNWDTICEAAQVFKERTIEHFENIKNSVSEKVENLKESVSEKYETLKGNVSNTLDNLKSKVDENGGGIKGLFLTYVDGYKATWESGFSKINDITGGKLGEAFDKVKDNMGNIKDEFKNKIQDAIDFVKDLPSKALEWGKDIIQNIVDGIRSKVAAVGDAVKSVADAIHDYIHFSEPDKGPLSDFHTYMPDMINEMSNGIIKGVPQIQRAMNELTYSMAPGRYGTATEGAAVKEISINTNALTDALKGALADSKGSDIIIPINIGGQFVDEIYIAAEQLHNFTTGGR